MVQDKIIAIVTFLFSYSLVPQVWRVYKMKQASQFSWQTVGITSAGLWVYAVVFFSMGMYYSAAMEVVAASCWTALLVAKVLFKD